LLQQQHDHGVTSKQTSNWVVIHHHLKVQCSEKNVGFLWSGLVINGLFWPRRKSLDRGIHLWWVPTKEI
jgi:hypothetical protein